MERSRDGYYPDPYVQYPRVSGQGYATPAGTGNAVPRARPAGASMEYMRTGQGAGTGPGRVEYYVQEHPAPPGTKPPGGEYYAHGPPAPGGVRPLPAATYYSQDPHAVQGGSKSCGCGGGVRPLPAATYYSQDPHSVQGGSKSCGCGGGAPKVEYSYVQGPSIPVPATRQVLPPSVSNQPPTAYYYVQEGTATRAPAMPAPREGDAYLPPRPYPSDPRGQQIIGYERYVVPASSAFAYDPTSAASRDYYRTSLPPGAPQPAGYMYDGDGYPGGHVPGSFQQLPQEVAERLGAMRIGGGDGGGGGRGASDVIYLPRPSPGDVAYRDSGMWRPRK